MADESTDLDQNQKASTGDKHKTEVETPDAKRTKIKTETSLDEANEDIRDEKQSTRQDVKQESEDSKTEIKSENGTTDATKADTDIPSSILEKGIIYFFMRGRVDVDKPEEVGDIARTFIILRPIPQDAKLSEGPLTDAGNSRILILPKKVLPANGRERFMAFVEKSGASYDEIKGQFLAGEEYETKTKGTRHTPAATPIGEGVYAITTTGRASHLVYMITIPEKLGEVQKDLGVKERGSFIISTKNPKYPSPASARLPKDPAYPKKILEEFRDLRWIPSQPNHLDYDNAQVLLIGESSGFKRALELQEDDDRAHKEEPLEEMEELEEKDLKRMHQLSGDHSAAIYADLKVHAEDYPKLQTTF
ncbi:uncharacterized protein TRIVIDRAFT_37177 [Trichoderma virens Gv29-8]|uniref:BTB domain transcription factor n=1 Tax=Hypocrea virens (strain Gv29-8 / FGSC 10586) TaxID=413071 RepID=G9MPH9_HYPVG|nr:uncharacterized protein TRIVIDRAFT_37177 [Trichoderma virens Gv29-8]EHK23780.1 hypothetical protein TRIVIDRAFT_37177 [Trichoderma virens Gv29-8]UKZ50078.1 hypothetical protein TrVGV298_004334 [Trichoderma virens]